MLNCLNESTNCNATTLTNNLVSNLFRITGALNYIASDLVAEINNFKNLDVTKIAQAKATYTNLGSQIGQIVRITFGYTKTHGNPVKPVGPVTPSM
jgi:hypothetical protein